MVSYEPAQHTPSHVEPTAVYPEARPSRLWQWTVAVLAVATLGMATLLAVVVMKPAASNGFTADEQAALEAAEAFSMAFMEFDYQDPDAADKAVRDKVVGDLAEDWEAGGEKIMENVVQGRITRTAEVNALALADDASDCPEDCVPVLVAVDTTTDGDDFPEPRETRWSMLLSMVEIDDGWKASQLEVNAD